MQANAPTNLVKNWVVAYPHAIIYYCLMTKPGTLHDFLLITEGFDGGKGFRKTDEIHCTVEDALAEAEKLVIIDSHFW